MAYTIPPFNVNSSTWTNYTVQHNCTEIIVSEVGQAATTDFYVNTLDRNGNLTAANFWTRAAGKEVAITGTFQKYDQPFAIKTASGSVNFDGIEKP